MVLSAPRSGSTWCANWLTSERTLCLHDPLLTFSERELDGIPCDRTLGIACTALPLLTDWVNKHPARKVILHRPMKEVNKSLRSIGLSELSERWDGVLDKIEGRHYEWSDMHKAHYAGAAYQFLTGLPFDAARWKLLVSLHVEPEFNRVHVKPDRARAFRRQIQDALKTA